MEKEIRRDGYLEQLIKRTDNGLIKIVTSYKGESGIMGEIGGRGSFAHKVLGVEACGEG